MYKYGEAVIFQDEKYKYIGSNSDGSVLLSKWGSINLESVISAPNDKVRRFLREGRTELGKHQKLNG